MKTTVARLREALDKVEQLRAVNTALQEANAQLSDENRQLLADNNDLGTRITGLEGEVANSFEEGTELTRQVAHFREDVKEYHAKVESQNEVIASLKHLLAETKTEIQRSKSSNVNLFVLLTSGNQPSLTIGSE
jgi:chromosome segregation ATPase